MGGFSVTRQWCGKQMVKRMSNKMSRGGKRPGAGRKFGYRSPTARTRQVSVKLTESERDVALMLGAGNASRGIRIALQYGVIEERRKPRFNPTSE